MTKEFKKSDGSITVTGDDGKIKTNVSTRGKVAPTASVSLPVIENFREEQYSILLPNLDKIETIQIQEEQVSESIPTLDTKCTRIECTHSAPFHKRYRTVDGKIELIHGQKWHYCAYCGNYQSLNWIHRHEIQCKSFKTSRLNCIREGHTHSEGYACGKGSAQTVNPENL